MGPASRRQIRMENARQGLRETSWKMGANSGALLHRRKKSFLRGICRVKLRGSMIAPDLVESFAIPGGECGPCRKNPHGVTSY